MTIRKKVHERLYPDWSDDGQIFWCDGKGYGLTETGQTVCVKEDKEDGREIKT